MKYLLNSPQRVLIHAALPKCSLITDLSILEHTFDCKFGLRGLIRGYLYPTPRVS